MDIVVHLFFGQGQMNLIPGFMGNKSAIIEVISALRDYMTFLPFMDTDVCIDRN